ncbi:MAG: hypothetical protein OMM_09022, partial [Candidatus Magnetoglobus multicellularis str. Araruama]
MILESQVGDGCAPEVETAIQSGNRAKHDMASMADSQIIIFLGLSAFTDNAPNCFLDPFAIPNQPIYFEKIEKKQKSV